MQLGNWKRRKFEQAEFAAYKRIIFGSERKGEKHLITYYKYFMLFDLFHILGYKIKYKDKAALDKVRKKFLAEFSDANVDKKLVDEIIKIFMEGDMEKLQNLTEDFRLKEESEYIRCIINNYNFKETMPKTVMVTATMSAGKSTFINALIGKYVCLSQNMACTSKIHRIINKPFEDGFIDKYDHDLALAAGKEELLHNNESNRSDRIIVGTRFIGELCNERIIVNDSPGVNFSRNYEHKSITEKIIKSRKFNLLIYIMNATQLGTNDESSHLEYVKKTIGRTPVLFLINKIDTFNIEEEDIEATIKRQIDFLKKKGFKNPMVCPVSSRAGYLAKRFMSTGLSRTEMRELYSLVDKFEQMNLPEYYAKAFKKISVPDSEKEEEQLLKTSGMSYVEKVIQVLTTGGNENGTDVR